MAICDIPEYSIARAIVSIHDFLFIIYLYLLMPPFSRLGSCEADYSGSSCVYFLFLDASICSYSS